jgi:hypothetical protein
MMVVGIRIKIYPKAKKNPYPAIAAGWKQKQVV